jgi:ABC-type amino acid transport substrate-binding protein
MTTTLERLLILAIATSLAGSAASQEGQRPVLRIASDATFSPFHFLDSSGAPTGFEIELARLAAQRAGFEPVVVVRPYDDLLSGLITGAHDLVAATTGITPEREARYRFTEPYFETCQAALVRVGADEPSSLAKLKGRRVGASGSGTAARAMNGIPGVEHVSVADGRGTSALENGDIDALVNDEFHAVEAARASRGRLRVLREPVAPEHYAFVLPKGRDDLQTKLNRALEEIANEGLLDELLARYGAKRDSEWPVDTRR